MRVWTGDFISVGYTETNGKLSLQLPDDPVNMPDNTIVIGHIEYNSSYKTNAKWGVHLVKSGSQLKGYTGSSSQTLVLTLDTFNGDITQVSGTYSLPLPENDSGTISLRKTDTSTMVISEPALKCCVQ